MMNILKWIYGEQVTKYEQDLKDCSDKLEQIKQELKSLKEQRQLAAKDLESIKELLLLVYEEERDTRYGFKYRDVPFLGDIHQKIDSYLHNLKCEQQIRWVRENGSKKQPASFHGGCTGCKSPETIGLYRCLGCKYLMGVTKNYPDLSFQ